MSGTLDRETRIKLAIHDYGTRDGASAKKVVAALRKDGFTAEEIAKAIREWAREPRG